MGSPGSLANRWLWRSTTRVAQQVGDYIDDAGLGDDVPDAPAGLVPVDHVVVAPAGGQRLGYQVVNLGPNLGDLGGREDVDGEQMARLVVPANLSGGEHLRFLDPQRDEPQVTIEFGEGVGALRRQEEFRVPCQLNRACNLADAPLER